MLEIVRGELYLKAVCSTGEQGAMTNRCRAPLRNVALLTGLFALALIATAFFHLCLHSADVGHALDSKHHCLLCTVFSHTITCLNPSDCLQALPISNGPPPLIQASGTKTPALRTASLRAPPRLG
jgi:hypothetical protein